jgi:hypothetical protein
VQWTVRTPRFPALFPSPLPSDSGRSARGEPGTPSSASCAAPRAPKPSPAIAILRPTRLDLALQSLVQLAPCPGPCETRDRHRLAPPRLSAVLEMEEQSSSWSTLSAAGSQNLIQKMSSANPHWGAPRIHGELQKLGIHLAQATVAKYMVRHRKPPSQTWRTFVENHAKELVSTDFFVVPTATFRLPFVFLVLSHDRRRLLHFGVTSHPPRRIGRPGNWSRPSPGIVHHATCCAIATEFMASRSRQPPIRWGFTRCSPLFTRRGKILIASASLARSGGNVWTISSCSTSVACTAL